MELLTAKKGFAHFTSKQFRAFVQAVVGDESYLACITETPVVDVLDGNILRIPYLMLIHHGGLFLVEDTDDVTYQNGTQGMKRIDLVVARYTKATDGIENGEWAIIPGTPDASSPVAPAHTEGNMQNGDLTDECPVFQVTYDGLNIESIECLVPIIKPLCEKQNQIKSVTSVPATGEEGDVYIVTES